MVNRSLVGRWGWVALGLGFGTLAASACSSDDEDTPGYVGTGNVGNKTGKGGRGGKAGGGEGGMGDGMAGDMGTGNTGNTGGAGEDDPLAPTVEITSPAAESNPNGEGVVVDDELDVVCEAKKASVKDAKAVDPSTVLIDMLDADGAVVDTLTPSEGPTGVFTARFITTKITDNGAVAFRCTAGDESMPSHTASVTLETFIDHGPEVEFSEPAMDETAIALGALKVIFTVKESPVAKGDDGAAVGDVSMTVRDVPIELNEEDGEYSATVPLDDGMLFPNVPDGSVPIIVQAGNRRVPVPALRRAITHVVVDGTGPTVTILDPPNQSVRGGKVTLEFTVTDTQSGVDPASVVVTLNKKEYRYSATDPDWKHTGDAYSFNFDTTQLERSEVQATIGIKAYDNVQNKSKDQALVLYLDNWPPIVDLDPPPVREGDSDNNCSLAFDPVGPAAANDLQVVYQLQKFRVLVWDRTNSASGQTDFYFSGPDLGSVSIRLQPHPEEGLLVDTNDDGVCDELVDESQDTPPEALQRQPLKGIQPQGVAKTGLLADDTLAADFPMPGGCKYAETTGNPDHLCPPTKSSDMTRVIPWDIDETIPAIFGLGSLMDNVCTGTDWEIGQFVEEGWICLAARALDNTGNVGISRPLRLCFDDEEGAPPACAELDAVPPSCVVDGCSLPPAFDEGQTFYKN